MKDIKDMSQVGYERLLNTLASVLHTQRRFIKIESEKRIDPLIVHYTVKKRSEHNRYLVSAIEISNRIIFKNEGLII